MAFTIATKHGERTFADKELVNISSKEGADIQINIGFDFLLTVQYDPRTNKCSILNQFNNPKFLFRGKTLPSRLEVDKVCKIMVDGSDEFITVKVIGSTLNRNISDENITENDIRSIYGSDINASAKILIEKRKSELEEARVAIIKDIGARVYELKRKISQNSKGGIIIHIAMLLASFICAFGVSNYLTGLPLSESVNVIQMPSNMKLIFVYAFIIYGIGLVLKQGIFLYLQNKTGEDTTTSRIAEKFMIVLSTIFYASVYLINVLYYIAPKTFPFFAVLISLFFVGTASTLAIACGYYKHINTITKEELDEIEYREDFEKVIKEYQQWIERMVNTMSHAKIQNINTRPMSFLFAGAFEKRARLIAEKESDSVFGFGAYAEKLQSYHRDLTMEDIAEAGCITELCGRIQKIVCLKKPEEGEFRRMLDIRGRGPVFELENEFNIRFELSEDKKDEMAHEAFESGLGIRGIKNRLRNYIDEAIWEDHTVHTIEVA